MREARRESANAAADDSGGREGSTIRKVHQEPAEPIDLVDVAGAPAAKRLVPVALALALLATMAVVYRRRRS